MSNRQFYNTPITPITPSESFSTFYDISRLTPTQQKDFNDLFSLVPPITDLLEQHMWFGKKPVGFFGSGNYQLFLENGSFTMQPNTTYRVRVVGGGGGGASAYLYGGGPPPLSAGAGGGYSERIIVCGDTEEEVAITVGLGGKGGKGVVSSGDSYGVGSNGGTSSFGAYCSATGGSGGSTASSIGGIGQGGDINFQGGGSAAVSLQGKGLGGASAASDFGNGISKTAGEGGNGLQSSATGTGGGGLFGNASGNGGGGLWGSSTGDNGGGMFVSDGGACYSDGQSNVYTLEWTQPQTYRPSSSAETQSNSFLTKHKGQGTAMSNNMFLISRMFGKGGTTAGAMAGLGGGAAYITTNMLIPGWGGAMGKGVILREKKGNFNWEPRRYPYNFSSFGAGSPQGGGAGVLTGGEVILTQNIPLILDGVGNIPDGYYYTYNFYISLENANAPQGGVGGGGGGVVGFGGESSPSPYTGQGMSGGCGAVLVEW